MVRCKVASQCEYQNPWKWLANEATIDDRKLTKSMPRRCSIQGIHMREKHLCKNLGVKEGVCLKEEYCQ